MRAERRFTATMPNPSAVRPAKLNSYAVLRASTQFPKAVIAAEDSPRLLISGRNSRKLGHQVVKGKWRGFPIYQLTLEERATCPRTCMHWLTCMGNSMHLARRHSHKGAFISLLGRELAGLQRAHPGGFVIRLHVLGDFFSVRYVEAWRQWLQLYPALHVFGFTAWQHESEIGAAVRQLADKSWHRFAIRTSDALTGPRALTIWRQPEAIVVREGIVCPAETGAADCCGSCSLCWAAPGKTIVFVAHGNSYGAGTPRDPPDVVQARNASIVAAWNLNDGRTIEQIGIDHGVKRAQAVRAINAARAVKKARVGRPSSRQKHVQSGATA